MLKVGDKVVFKAGDERHEHLDHIFKQEDFSKEYTISQVYSTTPTVHAVGLEGVKGFFFAHDLFEEVK